MKTMQTVWGFVEKHSIQILNFISVIYNRSHSKNGEAHPVF